MKHIIFDIDGTIFDTKQGIIACLNDVLLSNGDKPIISEEENRYIGPSIKDSLMRFNGYSEKLAIASTKQYRERYVDYFISLSVPYEGLMELLVELKNRGCHISIATMKTYKQVEKLLDLFKISSFFDCVETAREEGGYTKSDMLDCIKCKYPEDEFIFIGDTVGDYVAAKKSNVSFVYAVYGYGVIDDYEGKLIKSLSGLICNSSSCLI